jgi:uncharacterized damage-inducible protein DinB
MAAISADAFDRPAGEGGHSPKEILAHVAAYEDLIVQRLREARSGGTTSFDRDRDSWESFNDRIWAEAAEQTSEEVRADAARVFAELLDEVGKLSDAELTEVTGITSAVDPAWLDGRAMWELIGIDAFDHYAMHHAALEAAAAAD